MQHNSSGEGPETGTESSAGTPPRRALYIGYHNGARAALAPARVPGWVIDTCPCNADALVMAQTNPLGAVLIQMSPPVSRPVECIRRLRAAVPGLGVVALSRSPARGTIIAALMAGALGFLVLPVGARTLALALEGVRQGQPALCAQARGALRLLLRRQPACWKRLTPKQTGIARLLVLGQDDKSIAGELHMNPLTLHWHIVRIFRELGVGGRGQAIAKLLDIEK